MPRWPETKVSRPWPLTTRAGWSLALAALIVTLSIPFFLVDLPPVLDYPNHLAQAYVLAFGASSPVLSAMYAPHWTIFPNLAVDIIGPPLLHLFPVHVAGRLLLAGALFLPVIGAIAYHRAAFGARSYWPLAAGLAGFNGIFFLGFLNFLYGVGFALLGTALWIRNRERAPAAVVLGGAASTTIAFFCHIFAVLFFALLIGSQELARIWRPQTQCGPDGGANYGGPRCFSLSRWRRLSSSSPSRTSRHRGENPSGTPSRESSSSSSCRS